MNFMYEGVGHQARPLAHFFARSDQYRNDYRWFYLPRRERPWLTSLTESSFTCQLVTVATVSPRCARRSSSPSAALTAETAGVVAASSCPSTSSRRPCWTTTTARTARRRTV